MALSSVKSEIFCAGKSVEVFVDRFSSLPVKIAYHILSFLDVVDLSQLILVSKRCEQLCMSVPVLWLDNSKHTSDVASLKRYMLLVDNFLSIRQRTGTKVCQFNFTWKWLRQFFEEIETTGKGKRKRVHYNFELFSQVHQYFLRTVSCCGTESLNLSFISTELESQRLHPLFFDLTCNLKELTARTNNCSLGICDTMLCTSPKLEKLTLLSSKLNDTEISFMVYSLPSLKALCLHSCTELKKLALKSSSLEHLRIINENVVELEEIVIHCPLQTLFVMWYPYRDASPAFRVVSSQLKDFVWHGLPLGYYFSLQSIHLQNAAVHLTMPTKRAPWELSQASTDLLDAVIDQLKTTKSLTFHGNTIWVCV